MKHNAGRKNRQANLARKRKATPAKKKRVRKRALSPIPKIVKVKKSRKKKKKATPKKPPTYNPSWLAKGYRDITVCIVGNGPSAKGKAAEIDKCDFVVRTSIFPVVLKKAGKKMQAWCWNGSPRLCPKLMKVPPGKYEMWLSVHTTYRTTYEKFKRHMKRLAESHGPMTMVPSTVWRAMRAKVKVHPTTGLAAIALALEVLRPKRLVLYGFDATKRGKPGWGDANKKSKWSVTKGGHVAGHNMHLEKKLIHQLMSKGIWLGYPCATKVIWPNCPKEVR